MVAVVVVALPLAMEASIIQCLSQARIYWEGCSRKGIQHKMGDDEGGGTDSHLGWCPNGCRPADFGCILASVIFPCTIKWRAVMEEVDKGRSEF